MSSNDNKSSGDNMTRKQRRAAERSARKSNKGSAPSTSSGGGSGRSMVFITIGAVVIGLVFVIGLVVLSGDDAAAVSEPDSPAPAEELRQGRTLVSPDAESPVVVEVFEDPQCVHCGTFTKSVEPLLIGGPVMDGTASLTYNDYIIFGDESLDAAVAMRAADELDGKFWDYHHILFHNQAGVEDGSFSRDRLADMAELIGLEREAFLALLSDEDLRAGVAEDMTRGNGYGVSSTPSVVIDGVPSAGVPSWEDLNQLIEDAAAAAS